MIRTINFSIPYSKRMLTNRSRQLSKPFRKVRYIPPIPRAAPTLQQRAQHSIQPKERHFENAGFSEQVHLGTLTSQKRFEGNIITAMPLIVIMFLNVFSPDYLEPLYKTLSGRLIMTAALAGLVAAHFMTRRITKIEV